MRSSRDEPTVGTRLGPYDLLVPVGTGGMARVWVARIRGTGQVVALKLLLPNIAENPAFQEMFFDEARIASRVRHPNVCATYELGHYDEVFCLAMEWVDGPSLMRVLRPGHEDDPPRLPLHPRIAARIVADACAGLHAAHELVGPDGRSLGVVHRDASPHNILLTTSGQIKITDFGVAKAIGKQSQTIAGQIKGKLAYMAPEQLTGGTVDRRSDVFALGCVLYELTLGVRPFQGEHDPQVMTAIMVGRYEPPTAVAPGYPPELEAIIVRALANEPDQRYPTADQMRQALDAYLQTGGPPVTAGHVAALLRERCGAEVAARTETLLRHRPPPWQSGNEFGQPPRSGASEHRSVMGLVAAALLGAFVGVGILWYVHSSRGPKPTVASSVIELDAPPTASTATTASSAPPSFSAFSTPPTAAPLTVDGGVPTAAIGASAMADVVHVRATPASAVLTVNGVALAPGSNAVARPNDGGTVTVVVQADKHDDTIVLVDSTTADVVDVALVPVVRRPSTSTARPKDTAAPIETPPNPYE